MRSKLILWQIVLAKYENDLIEYPDDSNYICDSITTLFFDDEINGQENNALKKEMREYADQNHISINNPFWEANDTESRINFLKAKIQHYEKRN